MVFFCPEYWAEAKTDFSVCPSCSMDISGYSRRVFEDKLIAALGHPERETVRLAAWILGSSRSVKAVPSLCWAYRTSQDVFIKADILAALRCIGTPDSLAFIEGSLKVEPEILGKLLMKAVARQKGFLEQC